MLRKVAITIPPWEDDIHPHVGVICAERSTIQDMVVTRIEGCLTA